MFMLAIYKCAKATPATKEALEMWQQPLTTACKGPCSFLGSRCFADGCAQAATGRVSSWTLSLRPCCVSHSVPLGAAGASRSGSAV